MHSYFSAWKIIDQNPLRKKASNYPGNIGKKAISKILESLTWQLLWKLRLIQISSFLLGLIAARLLIDCVGFFPPKRFPCVHIRADAIKYFFLNYQMLIAKPELYYSNFSSSGRSCFQKSVASSGRELLDKKYETKIQVQMFQFLGKCPATKSSSSHQSQVPQYVNHPIFINCASVSNSFPHFSWNIFKCPTCCSSKIPNLITYYRPCYLTEFLLFG